MAAAGIVAMLGYYRAAQTLWGQKKGLAQHRTHGTVVRHYGRTHA